MKNTILIFFIFFLYGDSYSQELQWNRSYLTLDNVRSNSYTLYNSSDNTIKVKLFNQGRFDNQFLIPAKGSLEIYYPSIKEFNKFSFDEFELKVYYDIECYSYDLKRINAEAERRIRNEQVRKNFKSFLRIGAIGLAQLSEEGSDWQKAGELGNMALDIYDTYNSVKNDGLTYGTLNYMKGEFKNKLIDETVKNKYLNTTIKSLDALYENVTSEIEVDLSDLERGAIDCSFFISDDPYSVYSIDYERSIRPIVDLDNDGITNKYDECPRLKGDIMYNGCTKVIYVQRKKAAKKRRKTIRVARQKAIIKKYTLELGYHRTEFNNTHFSILNESGQLKHDLGIYYKIEFPVYPFYLYGQYFQSDYKIVDVDNWPFEDDEISHAGYEVGVKLAPLAYSKISKVIIPRIGAGYQFSSVCGNCEGETKSVATFRNPIAKVGVLLILGKNIHLNVEYSKTFISQKENTQIEAGLGIRF